MQVEGLEAAVEDKNAELMTLRKTLEHKAAQVWLLCTPLFHCEVRDMCRAGNVKSGLALHDQQICGSMTSLPYVSGVHLPACTHCTASSD